jgi:hypothetical protein
MRRAATDYGDNSLRADSAKVLTAIVTKQNEASIEDALMDAAYHVQKEIETQIQTTPGWATPTKAGNHPLIGPGGSLIDFLSSAVRVNDKIKDKE